MMKALTNRPTDGQTDRWMDGWMDTQNFGGYNIIPLPIFVAEHKNRMTVQKQKKH